MTRRLAAAAAAFLLAGCASVPEIDRYLLQQEREPVRVEGARRAFSHAESAKLLDQLAK